MRQSNLDVSVKSAEMNQHWNPKVCIDDIDPMGHATLMLRKKVGQ